MTLACLIIDDPRLCPKYGFLDYLQGAKFQFLLVLHQQGYILTYLALSLLLFDNIAYLLKYQEKYLHQKYKKNYLPFQVGSHLEIQPVQE